MSKNLRDDPKVVRAFYLAIAPDLFGPTCEYIKKKGYYRRDARVVIEKPLGHDLKSSIQINSEVSKIFAEDQVYRIDHYLGKETVQNLLALRFANTLFEPIWNSAHIDHVQLTVAESVGAGTRGYYDESGALRDMVQNHMLQLLCLVAMEPLRYWPRTVALATSAPLIGFSERSTLSFSSRSALASSEAGGSIATRQSSCSIWFCTMSRSAPLSS